MASVVFEKQLANIKKGLELLHEMTQSMQELTDLSNENFMQKNNFFLRKEHSESKISQHNDSKNNPIITKHLEIMIFDIPHQELDRKNRNTE